MTLATPTMASRVTSAASCSSDMPSVPAGAPAGPGSAAPRCYPRPALRYRLAVSGPNSRKNAAGVDHRARAVGRGLVPDRRQTEDRPGITGTQGAHDQIVHVRSVLDDHHVLALSAGVSQLGDGGRRVAQQAASCRRDPPTRARRPCAPLRGPTLCSYVSIRASSAAGSTSPFSTNNDSSALTLSVRSEGTSWCLWS